MHASHRELALWEANHWRQGGGGRVVVEMRIAVIGAGVSGCLVARLLATRHETTLYESRSEPGGHAQTIDVEIGGKTHPVDVAFMVFNRRTYPNFSHLLDRLGVAEQPSDMSFSVRNLATGLEYQGGTLRGLLAQRSNCVKPSFWRMVADILRFNRIGLNAVRDGSLANDTTVGDILGRHNLGKDFARDYLTPMAAAIWSSKPSEIRSFPAKFLIGFFANHGLLQLRNRPQWQTVVGGSREYVAALLQGFGDRLRLDHPIVGVRRTADGVEVKHQDGATEKYDQVVLATHANQTLRLLTEPTPNERSILADLPYQSNQAALHTDVGLLPKRRNAWASWNYRVAGDCTRPAAVTYDLSRLQGLDTPTPLLLTLNETGSIEKSKILREFSFAHPAYSVNSIKAQQQWSVISGCSGIHYCGAYWGYGFHEDGVRSALAVANHFGIDLEACTAACTKAPSPTTGASP